MSAMKAFMEIEAHYYNAGLEAGRGDDIFALAGALCGIEADAASFAIPIAVAGMLTEALFEGWAVGYRAFDLAFPVDIRIQEQIG
jgi:hypothetical protein